MNICITGQRPESLDKDYTYSSDLWKFIYKEIEEKFHTIRPKKIYTGMALGVDTVAAEIAISMEIPFVACIPFIGQEDSWPAIHQARYLKLLEKAQSRVVIGNRSELPWVYQKRNEYMVDNSDIVLATWNGFKGGTRNCIEYALRKKITVIRIDPNTHRVGRYDGTKHIQELSLAPAN